MASIGTRKLTVMIDGVESSPQVSRVVIGVGDTDSDFVTFADARAGGGKQYTVGLTIVQDAAVGSVWDQIWSHSGEEIDVVVRPYGNATPTAAEPHFAGTVVVRMPDGDLLGGEADASATNKFTVEAEWIFTAKPTKVTA